MEAAENDSVVSHSSHSPCYYKTGDTHRKRHQSQFAELDVHNSALAGRGATWHRVSPFPAVAGREATWPVFLAGRGGNVAPCLALPALARRRATWHRVSLLPARG